MEGQSSPVKNKRGPILALDVCRRCLGAWVIKVLSGPLVEWLVFNPRAVKGGRHGGPRELPPPLRCSHQSRTAASFHSRETTETQEADKTETSH